MGAYRQQLKVKSAGRTIGLAASLLLAGLATGMPRATAQDGGTITLRSDIQEANAQTGVVTARGNVQIDYPARAIYATAAQAQYFSNEQRIVLSGDVVVLQEGNRLVAETVTYLVEEGRFVALPNPNEQVEATYIVPASSAPPAADQPMAEPSPEPAPSLEITPIQPNGEDSAPLSGPGG
ncbi:hypothetical protein C7271_22105 [filamentous cyanobacterium CCP5]|nr:hypothetical protein C7271_22105 [filamentous cyanobacterium CCP5]